MIRRPFVKVCGITRIEDAIGAVALGVDAVGMILAPESPRHVSLGLAARIVAAVGGRAAAVAVTINAAPEDVARWRAAARFDAIQAHGEETPEVCAAYPVPCVKAIRSRPGLTVDEVAEWGAFPILLDGFRVGSRGGTGHPADPGLAGELVARGHRVILAGGLSPQTLRAAVERTCPLAVDLNSGVESSLGVKDLTRLEAALAALDGLPTPPPEERPW